MDVINFFSSIRTTIFHGKLSQQQVDGVNNIIQTYAKMNPTGPVVNKLAYCLATATWETGFTMSPIKEWGLGKDHIYGQVDPNTLQTYYGRGYVQLTWLVNYRKLGSLLNVNLVYEPDLAMKPDIAAEILIMGMENGLFTGKKLDDYFPTPTNSDPLNARKIINGTDRALEIAHIYNSYIDAFSSAMQPVVSPIPVAAI